jgi:rod shape determining protein RodA
MFTFLKERVDLRIAFAALTLSVIGVVSVYSATFDARVGEIFSRQLTFLGVGVVIALVVALVPFRTLQMIALPVYVIAIAMLVAVLLLGRTVSGSTSWFNLGLFRVQPSEFAKIATILALAAYLSRSDVSLKSMRNLAIATGIVALPAGLVMAQPDFGTVLIYVGLYLPILFWGGATRFTMIAIIAPGAVAIAALFGTTTFLLAVLVFGVMLYLTMEHRIVAVVAFSLMVTVGISVQAIYDGLKPYQQKRIATFLDPGADPLGAGYNILQSKVAIGSGGFFGKGYLRGTQTQLNFIPEQWTDFIFCVPAEEFGFIGGVLVLVLFALLLYRGVALATIVKSSFASTIAIGVTGVFATHVFMNIGMALGLLPVVGVPLPFLSYGGSFLVASLVMTGLLLNIYFNRKEY